MQDRWAEVTHLVDQALDLGPVERGPFLLRACAGDSLLRAEVDRLLAAAADTGEFLNQPAASELAPLLSWVARQETQVLAAGTRFGAYEVISPLGRGGMAAVYVAHDRKHHRTVAVKVFDTDVGAQVGREWFLQEIAILAGLHHPHILPLHDSGEVAGRLYYVMPHVEGESLRQRLSREGRIPPATARRIVQEVAGALDYAHRQGVIHRDIKPENILLQDGQAVVADFGIAHAIRTGAVEGQGTGGDRIPVLGTPTYMSPEQAAGAADIDARSDIYALGCVLYEMLAGRPPFTGPTPQAIQAQHARAPIPLLAQLQPSVPPGLVQVVSRALSKDPAGRFPGARAFAEALAQPPVSTSRGALDGARRRWVVTVGTGLTILIGLSAARMVESFGAGKSPGSVASVVEDERSIAVLPLANLSPDKEDAYFADGMTDELTDALGRVEGLRVAARVSAFAFKGVPVSLRDVHEQLHVATVLDGSVRKAGDRLRVMVELVRTRDGRRLWSETYDRGVTDVFTVQAEVARAVTGALQLDLAGAADARMSSLPTEDLEAYKLYLKGRSYSYSFRREERARAVEFFALAVARDSDYARAWAGLADGYSLMTDFVAPREMPAVRERARIAALRAVSLDSTLAEAQAALGDIQYYFDWDWLPAERSLRRAIALDPNEALTHRWYAELLMILGRYPEVVTHAELAERLDPLNPFMVFGTVWAYTATRQYGRAVDAALRWVELDSTSSPAYLFLGRSQLLAGRPREALASLEHAAGLAKGGPHPRLELAYFYAATGQRDKARRILSGVERSPSRAYPPSTDFAAVYAALGDLDGAMTWLERGYTEHGNDMPYLAVMPWLDPLRHDPRFVQLQRRMRIPE